MHFRKKPNFNTVLESLHLIRAKVFGHRLTTAVRPNFYEIDQIARSCERVKIMGVTKTDWEDIKATIKALFIWAILATTTTAGRDLKFIFCVIL